MSDAEGLSRNKRLALKYARLGYAVFPLKVYEENAPKERDSKTPHECLGVQGGHTHATTDPAQIKAWWDAYPQAGIGVYLARSGLIAIDVDNKPGVAEFVTKLEEKHGHLEPTVVQLTPTGGKHFLYRAPEGLTTAPAKLHGNKGVDIKFQGYICLAPTVHPVTGTEYQWLKGLDPKPVAELTEVPAWTLKRVDKLGEGAMTVGGDDADIFRADTPKLDFSIERLRDIIAYVPNDDEAGRDREDWFKVLCALWHETDGSEEGRQIALEWSEQHSSHRPELFDKAWRSADHRTRSDAPVTFRYVMDLAKPLREKDIRKVEEEADWAILEATSVIELMAAAARYKPIEMSTLERVGLAQHIQARYKAITGEKLSLPNARNMVRYTLPEGAPTPDWAKGKVHLSIDNTIWRIGGQQTWTPWSFNSQHNRYMLTDLERAEGKASPDITAWDACVNRFLIPTVLNRMYMPGYPPYFSVNGERYVNSFDPNSIPPQSDRAFKVEELAAIKLVEDHIYFLCGDDEPAEIFLSWLASPVQSQARCDWAVVVQSPQGIGKSFVGNLMGAVLGGNNVNIVSPSLLEEKFTPWAEGSLLNITEEMKLHGHNRFDVLNKLKPYITDMFVSVRRMNTNAYKVLNTANYLIFTNYRDSLPIGLDDTRYYMISHPDQRADAAERFKLKHPGYFEALYRTIEDHADALREWFHRFPLHPKFNRRGRAPDSAEKNYVAELNKSDEVLDLEDAIDNQAVDRTEHLFNASAWNADRIVSGSTLATNALKRIMTDANFSYLGRVRVNGSRDRYWTKQPDRWPLNNKHAVADRIRMLLKDPM